MKTYKKPEIYFEHFELAEHIAGCNLTMNNADVSVCTASGTIEGDRSDAWFVDDTKLCNVPLDDYCYSSNVVDVATINS